MLINETFRLIWWTLKVKFLGSGLFVILSFYLIYFYFSCLCILFIYLLPCMFSKTDIIRSWILFLIPSNFIFIRRIVLIFANKQIFPSITSSVPVNIASFSHIINTFQSIRTFQFYQNNHIGLFNLFELILWKINLK